MKALIVEDFASFRLLVFSMLHGMGVFQLIDQAADGLEALEKAEQLQPDLVVLDIGLPNVNGLEVAERVRHLAPHAAILFLSQQGSSDVVREVLSFGALGYVHKSRAGSELLPAIKAVLAGNRYISEGLDDIEFRQGMTVQPPCHHEVLFFADEAVLVDRLTHFIATALTAGNPALVFATEAHRESLLQRLKEQRVNIDAAMQQGTYISLDVAEPADPARLFETVGGLIAAATKAGKIGPPRLALCGERAGLLWAEGKTNTAIQVEQFCSDLATRHNVDVFCAYPLVSSTWQDEQSFNSICEIHSAVSY